MSGGEPVYFGCIGGVGHSFYDIRGDWLPKCTPWGYGVEQLTPKSTTAQNAAALRQRDGWSALAVHDYTIDHRGNSKSVFCFPQYIGDMETAWQRARESFPAIVARLERAAPVSVPDPGEDNR